MRISDWSSDVCSSDLRCRLFGRAPAQRRPGHAEGHRTQHPIFLGLPARRAVGARGAGRLHASRFQGRGRRHARRSEEHTSELQSLMRISYAVFCLKKKNSIRKQMQTYHTNTTTNKTYHIKRYITTS